MSNYVVYIVFNLSNETQHSVNDTFHGPTAPYFNFIMYSGHPTHQKYFIVI